MRPVPAFAALAAFITLSSESPVPTYYNVNKEVLTAIVTVSIPPSMQSPVQTSYHTNEVLDTIGTVWVSRSPTTIYQPSPRWTTLIQPGSSSTGSSISGTPTSGITSPSNATVVPIYAPANIIGLTTLVLALAYLGREIWLWLKGKLGIGETATQTAQTATDTGDVTADASETATRSRPASQTMRPRLNMKSMATRVLSLFSGPIAVRAKNWLAKKGKHATDGQIFNEQRDQIPLEQGFTNSPTPSDQQGPGAGQTDTSNHQGHLQAADKAPSSAIPEALLGVLAAVQKTLGPAVAAAQETGTRMGNIIEGCIPTNVIGTIESYTRELFSLWV